MGRKFLQGHAPAGGLSDWSHPGPYRYFTDQPCQAEALCFISSREKPLPYAQHHLGTFKIPREDELIFPGQDFDGWVSWKLLKRVLRHDTFSSCLCDLAKMLTFHKVGVHPNLWPVLRHLASQ